MNRLRKEFDACFIKWLEQNAISRGNKNVSINRLLRSFEDYVSETIPVTKAMFGRAMSARFVKKQNPNTLETEYYINKQL